MGEETCRECRSWEEELYWTHFQCTHFFQILRPGFAHHLALPEKFSKNVKKKLAEVVTLKGPSGSKWEVRLTMIDNMVLFGNGWEKFVKNHVLQENDLLVFKFNGDSHFDVLVFDGETMCEKAASYFVRKCGHREPDCAFQPKRRFREGSIEDVLPSPQDVVGGTSPEKSADTDIYTTPIGKPSTSQANSKKVRREVTFTKPSLTRQNVGDDETSDDDDDEEEDDEEDEKDIKPDVEITAISPNVPYSAPYVSRRRLVSEQDKQNALRLAQAALSKEGFIVVMKPTHVYRKFYMVIPSGWTIRNLSTLGKQNVILRMKDKTWLTRFCYQKVRGSGGLSAGWKNFAKENNLQEYDVCVFEPSSPENNTIVLDVNIFRVNVDFSLVTGACVTTKGHHKRLGED